jgi:ADP-heptose:LPS heptosyltransferase
VPPASCYEDRSTKPGAKRFLFRTTRVLRPLARLGAKGGYFARRDWSRISARRIALITCHWIGDTFWAAQVVPALLQRFPGAELYAIGSPVTADLWNGLVPRDRVLAAPEVVSDRRRQRVRWGAIRRRARELGRLGFDLAIDLTGNRYSAAFTYWLRPAASVGFDGGELGWLYSLRVADAERVGRHLSERPFRVIEPLLGEGAEAFAYRLPLRPPEATRPAGEVREELGVAGRSYFVLAPGAGWPAKEWPPERFIEAGRCLAGGGAVVVVGSAAEEALCRRLAGGIPGAKTWTGRPIGEVVALLGEARGVLANDSGVAHLAAALGRPTAAVFTGATDPQLCRPLGQAECVRVFGPGDAPAAVAAHLLG